MDDLERALRRRRWAFIGSSFAFGASLGAGLFVFGAIWLPVLAIVTVGTTIRCIRVRERLLFETQADHDAIADDLLGPDSPLLIELRRHADEISQTNDEIVFAWSSLRRDVEQRVRQRQTENGYELVVSSRGSDRTTLGIDVDTDGDRSRVAITGTLHENQSLVTLARRLIVGQVTVTALNRMGYDHRSTDRDIGLTVGTGGLHAED